MLRIRFTAPAVAALALVAIAAWAATAHATTRAAVPHRIVSLSPTATEDLFAVGAGTQVVAVDSDSDYPKQAPHTKLSAYTPNVEAIAKMKPDLVVVGYDRGEVAPLRKLGIRVVVEPAAATIAQDYGQILDLGRLTGHSGAAASLVASMKQQLAKVVASVPRSSAGRKIFVELGPELYSATSRTFMGSIFALFGLKNIADDADPTHSGYPQLSSEYVLAANPDIVVLADTRCCGQTPATVAARPGWSNVSAVEHHRVVAVDDDIASRWGPRILQFAKAVAAGARRP